MKWTLDDFDWKTFDTMYALDSFGQYWLENEALIKKAGDAEEDNSGPKWSPKDEDELGEYHMEIRDARRLHDEIMAPMFRYSCIVMLHVIIERELRRLLENLEKERGPQKLKVNEIRGASFLAQVCKFIEVFFGLQLPVCPQYHAICDLQKIRDCIIHCRGEVSLSRDKAYLLSLKVSRPGFYAWEGTDIEIRPDCVEQFIKETWLFFTWTFNELKWKTANWKLRLSSSGLSEANEK
jgi:hypothetical protein